MQSRDLSRIACKLRKLRRPLQKVRENVFVLSPLVLPLHGRYAYRVLNSRLLCRQLLQATAELGFSRPAVWTYNPLVVGLLDAIEAPLVVYHCVDNLAAAPRMPVDAIGRAESTLATRADAIFTTSPRLQAKFSAVRPDATFYFPNVADYEHFATAAERGALPADLLRIPRPRIGFIGAVSRYKVDFELIAAVAAARQALQWVLIGPVGEGQPHTRIDPLRRSNIHLLGARSYESLPDYLRGFDVAAIPAPRNDYTDSMFPMKFFEYLAAGRPVVATNIPSLAEFSGVCHLVDDAAGFAVAVDAVLAGCGPDVGRARKLARRYTWTQRTDEMLAAIESRLAARGLARRAA